MLTPENVRQSFALLEELNERAERIIQTYFRLAQPGGYARDARVDEVTDATVSIKYDWTWHGTDTHWQSFPFEFLFLNEPELTERMSAFITREKEEKQARVEQELASAKKLVEVRERNQLARLKAKYEH